MQERLLHFTTHSLSSVRNDDKWCRHCEEAFSADEAIFFAINSFLNH